MTVTHPWPAATDRSADWSAAGSFETFLAGATQLLPIWVRNWERTVAPPAAVARAAAIPGHWRLLGISADWCTDAVDVVPVLARLAEAVPGWELRLLDRDAHLPLMDEHLTNGRSRSIPAVLVLDGDGRERAWWGPRPAPLQAWVMGEGQTVEASERYREIRKWHLRDGGATVLDEVLSLVESVAGASAPAVPADGASDAPPA